MGNQCCTEATTSDPYKGLQLTPLTENKATGTTPTPFFPSRGNINVSQNSELEIIVSSQDDYEDEDIQHNLPKLSQTVIKIFRKHKVKKISKEAKKLMCKNENIYFGQVEENGLPSGYGKMLISDGSTYIGEFRKGNAQGQGVLAMIDGGCYCGKFKDGQSEDQLCQYVCEQTGYTYQGGIKNGQLHGRGKEKTKEYEFLGEYANGKRLNGKLTWKQFVYEGKFNKDQQFHGTGVLRDSNGVYHGEFKNGLKDGKGSYKSKLGIVYEGEYAKGMKQGKGKIYNKIGRMVFEGMLADNIPNGPGALIDDDEKIYRGEFKQGLLKMLDDRKIQKTICDYL